MVAADLAGWLARGNSIHMFRWVRLAMAVLALVGVLGARPGAAAPTKAAHQHHHCIDMMDEQNYPGDSHGTVPDCCIAATCAMVQPVFSELHSVLTPLAFTQASQSLRNDAWHSGVRPPPDLRPPIA